MSWSPRGSEPPASGVIFDDNDNAHEVDFKTGTEDREGHTLISDHSLTGGDSKAFDSNHDHYYGDGDGQDRGNYSGPGSR